jgi:hypothetical protein
MTYIDVGLPRVLDQRIGVVFLRETAQVSGEWQVESEAVVAFRRILVRISSVLDPATNLKEAVLSRYPSAHDVLRLPGKRTLDTLAIVFNEHIAQSAEDIVDIGHLEDRFKGVVAPHF